MGSDDFDVTASDHGSSPAAASRSREVGLAPDELKLPWRVASDEPEEDCIVVNSDDEFVATCNSPADAAVIILAMNSRLNHAAAVEAPGAEDVSTNPSRAERHVVVPEFTQHRRTQIAEMRPFVPGETLRDRVSISKSDLEAGSPKLGDMIARNPKNHEDQWLVAADYFADNFEPMSADRCYECNGPLNGPYCPACSQSIHRASPVPSSERDELVEDIDEAADDLIDSAQYLQETLEAGEGVYESKWLGGVMRAHELLLKLSEHIKHASAWPCDGEGDESGNFVCKNARERDEIIEMCAKVMRRLIDENRKIVGLTHGAWSRGYDRGLVDAEHAIRSLKSQPAQSGEGST